ncbi:MAG: hypothetical protein ABSH53_02935 [Holophaga sp.]|jgi:hypothetical protein
MPPTLTIPQYVFIEVCKGILADPQVHPSPQDLVILAKPLADAITAALPPA